MPKVVIELTANTAQAVAQIQAFGKAQRDTFDALRTGNPALAESSIRVSKLVENAKAGTEGFTSFNREARALAHGGITDLLSSVPIVGNSMGKLAHELAGFPLLIGGVVGVGVALLTLLKGWDDAATKALQSIGALNAGMVADFRHTQTEVAKIAAEMAGDRARVSALTAKQEIDDADAVLQAKIADASKELGTYDILGNQRTQLSSEALAKIAAAELEHADKVVVINAKKNADLAKLEQDRKAFHLANLAELTAAEAAATQATLLAQGKVLEASEAGLEADTAKAKARLDAKLVEIQQLYQATDKGLDERRTAEAKYQQDVIALEANAAKQRQTIIEGLTTAALASVKTLGAGFTDIEQKLTLATFLQNTQKAIAQWLDLGVAITNGDKTLTSAGLTIQNVQDVVKALTQEMQDAISKGIAPTTEALKDLTTAADDTVRGFGAMHNEVSDLITEINDISQAFVTFTDNAVTGTKQATAAVTGLADAIWTVDKRIDAIQKPLTVTGNVGPGGIRISAGGFAAPIMPGGLQAGGMVATPRIVAVAEHGPEIVLGPPTTQAFAAEFAAAIASHMGGAANPAVNVSITTGPVTDAAFIDHLARQVRVAVTEATRRRTVFGNAQ